MEEEEDEGTITSTGIVLRDPRKTSSNALGLFVKHMTNYYQNHEEEGHDLWLNFIQDFGDWDEASFKKVDKALIQDLRNLLLDRDVYTPKDTTHVYKHLARLVDQLTWPEWPANVPKPKKKSYVDDPASNSNTRGTPAPGNPQFTKPNRHPAIRLSGAGNRGSSTY